MLDIVFKNIRDQKEKFASSNSGEQFEEKLMIEFKQTGFLKIYNSTESKKQKTNFLDRLSKLTGRSKKEIEYDWEKIKAKVLAKNSLELIDNPWKNISESYIYQPFGSQQFPDFLFFTKNQIVPIEVKFSKAKVESDKELKSIKPMWNSNLPKANSLYIFGVSNKRVTFFSGSDVLDSNTRVKLNQFFDELGGTDEDIENKIKNMLSDLPNPFGFKPYIRKAFDQSVNASTLVSEDGKLYIESFFSEKSSEREKNVIEFLESLNEGDYI